MKMGSMQCVSLSRTCVESDDGTGLFSKVPLPTDCKIRSVTVATGNELEIALWYEISDRPAPPSQREFYLTSTKHSGLSDRRGDFIGSVRMRTGEVWHVYRALPADLLGSGRV